MSTVSGTPGKTNHKVLIVDDIAENVHILMATLKEKYKIVVALNGENALKIAFSENPPDLILLDIMMPVMDGYEVCAKLKENPTTRDIPIIFITAKDDVAAEAKGLAAGAVDYITKPFHPHIVQARVKTHLALKSAYDHISNEVAFVAELQEKLLPREEISTPDLTVSSYYKPSGQASGDYYDFFFLNDHTFRVIVADVAGHGAGSAFIMGIARTLFHLSKEYQHPLNDTINLLNNQMVEIMGDDSVFLTAMAADINLQTGRIDYINAGHCPALLKTSDSEIVQLNSSGPLIGFFAFDYVTQTIEIPPHPDGSIQGELLMYTDGIYEFMVAPKIIFGLDPFLELAKEALVEKGNMFELLESKLIAASPCPIELDDDVTGLYVKFGA